MQKNYLHHMIAWLAQMMRCPVCDQRYSFEHTYIVESHYHPDEGHLVVHADCQECHSSAVFTVSLSANEVFSVGMLSDLQAADVMKLHSRQAVSVDDILQLHNFLETFDGNFERLFSKLS